MYTNNDSEFYFYMHACIKELSELAVSAVAPSVIVYSQAFASIDTSKNMYNGAIFSVSIQYTYDHCLFTVY